MGTKSGPELLPGTLDLLILRTPAAGSQHGYGIASHLKTVCDNVLQVGESSLYPALQRLLLNGWVRVRGRLGHVREQPARPVLLADRAGRRQLTQKRDEFDRIVFAIHRVLDAT